MAYINNVFINTPSFKPNIVRKFDGTDQQIVTFIFQALVSQYHLMLITSFETSPHQII